MNSHITNSEMRLTVLRLPALSAIKQNQKFNITKRAHDTWAQLHPRAY